MANPEGMVQYFYHCPVSVLPVRDVLNLQGWGFKSEPHVEVGAENLIDCCYQPNIARFAKSAREYLFLLTRCANPELRANYDKQYIVGYIRKQEIGQRDRYVFIRGDTKLFSFQDSVPVLDIFGWNFNRIKLVHNADVDSEKTSRILGLFSGKKNILEECVREINRLDPEMKTCRADVCEFTGSCLRFRDYISQRKPLPRSSCRNR